MSLRVYYDISSIIEFFLFGISLLLLISCIIKIFIIKDSFRMEKKTISILKKIPYEVPNDEQINMNEKNESDSSHDRKEDFQLENAFRERGSNSGF